MAAGSFRRAVEVSRGINLAVIALALTVVRSSCLLFNRKVVDDDFDDDDEDEDDDDYVPPEIEDDGSDKAKLKDFKIKESFPVHCPYFPDVKDECWWIFLGHSGNDTALTHPVKVATLKDEETVEIQFMAPPDPGTYDITLYVLSDSYMGIDQEKTVRLTVVKGEDPVVPEEDLIEEEDSDALTEDEDDEDSDDSDF